MHMDIVCYKCCTYILYTYTTSECTLYELLKCKLNQILYTAEQLFRLKNVNAFAFPSTICTA